MSTLISVDGVEFSNKPLTKADINEWIKKLRVRVRSFFVAAVYMHVWCANGYVHSHSIIFFNWCLTQWRVRDSGHPTSVWYQNKDTEDNRVNARLSELLDLPRLYEQWLPSSPTLKSLE